MGVIPIVTSPPEKRIIDIIDELPDEIVKLTGDFIGKKDLEGKLSERYKTPYKKLLECAELIEKKGPAAGVENRINHFRRQENKISPKLLANRIREYAFLHSNTWKDLPSIAGKSDGYDDFENAVMKSAEVSNYLKNKAEEYLYNEYSSRVRDLCRYLIVLAGSSHYGGGYDVRSEIDDLRIEVEKYRKAQLKDGDHIKREKMNIETDIKYRLSKSFIDLILRFLSQDLRSGTKFEMEDNKRLNQFLNLMDVNLWTNDLIQPTEELCGSRVRDLYNALLGAARGVCEGSKQPDECGKAVIDIMNEYANDTGFCLKFFEDQDVQENPDLRIHFHEAADGYGYPGLFLREKSGKIENYIEGAGKSRPAFEEGE